MGHDVMKSVRSLVPDILAFHGVLIYLGQFDAECGVAQNDAWMNALQWCAGGLGAGVCWGLVLLVPRGEAAGNGRSLALAHCRRQQPGGASG
jgi:hypothetical protein